MRKKILDGEKGKTRSDSMLQHQVLFHNPCIEFRPCSATTAPRRRIPRMRRTRTKLKAAVHFDFAEHAQHKAPVKRRPGPRCYAQRGYKKRRNYENCYYGGP